MMGRLAAWIWLILLFQAGAGAGTFRAGAHRVDITPRTFPIDMVGELLPRSAWRCNEFGGPFALDATGRGNRAVYEDGIAFYLEGPQSPAFSGTEINRAPHLAGGRMKAALAGPGERYSVEMWFHNAMPAEARPVAGYLLECGGDRLALGARLQFVRDGQVWEGKNPVALKSWNHVVLVRDRGSVSVYWNGQPAPEIAGQVSPRRPTGEILIGGKIDEVAVFDRALGREEITRHYLLAAAAQPSRVEVTLAPGTVNISSSGRVPARCPSCVQIDFDAPRRAEVLSVYPRFEPGQPRWKSYRVEINEDGAWRELPQAGAWIMPASMHFPVKARIQGARLVVSDAGRKTSGPIAEIEVLGPGKDEPAPRSTNRFLSLEEYDLSRGQSIDLSRLDWRFHGGDDSAWSEAGYDDSEWKKIQVGRSWLEQDPARPVGWYRVRFAVPESWRGSPVALDLGTASAYGLIHINGKPAGRFGSPLSTNPFHTSSVIRAVHHIPAPLLRYGADNLLAIRCHTGDFGGLYKGPYRAVRLTAEVVPQVRIDTEWKVRGAGAPFHYLSTHEHLNTYREGEPVNVQPTATVLLDDPGPFFLSYTLLGRERRRLASGVFGAGERDGPIHRFRAVRLPALPSGSYQLRITCQAGSRKLQEAVLPFRVEPPMTAASFVQDPELAGVAFPESPRSLDRESIGHYGGNRFRQNSGGFVLDYDLSEGNANGNLVNSTLVARFLPGPMLFSHNYKDPPRRLLTASDYMTAISSYRSLEGMDGQWSFGFFGPEHGLMPASVEVESASWTGVRYMLRYPGASMRFHENNLSPAALVELDHPRAVLFSGMGLFGVGPPSRVALAAPGAVRTADLRPGTRVDLRERSENWLLFSFHGAAGFDEFDVPYLVVTEKKARALQASEAGMELEYPDGSTAGRIWVMPLYGQRMLALEETASWRAALPASVLRDVRFWSSALLAYPVACRERYRVFGDRHRVAIEESFEYIQTVDEWGTKATLIAPVPPVLSLAARYRFPVSFGQPVEPSSLIALQGPFAFARGGRLRFAIDDVIRLGNEVRAVDRIPASDPVVQRFRARLNAETERILTQFRLEQHPWAAELLSEGSRSTAQPGTVTPFLIDLTLAIPHLNQPLAGRVARAVRDEIDTALMKPENYIRMSNRHTPLVTPVYHLSLTRLGIDNMAWSGTHLYALWVYAHTTGDWSLVEKHWPEIKLLFNILPNSADWGFFTPWDILNGVRLGNGIQEVAHGLAGMAAHLRMAARQGDETERDFAAYLLARQGVSLYAQFAGNRWARVQVPWLISAPWAEAALKAEETAVWRHTEPVEFRGYSLNTIQSRSLIPAASFILTPVPEILRFYHEYAREESNYYWTRILPRIPWEHWSIKEYHGLMVNIADEMLYTIDIPRGKVVELAEREALRPKEWFLGTIPNFRAVIEASGRRNYRQVVWPDGLKDAR